MTKTWSVDPASYDLAKNFLPAGTEAQLRDLSQSIQDAIEDWLELDERERLADSDTDVGP